MENRQKNYGSVHDTKASMMYNRFLKQYNEWLSGGPIPDTGNQDTKYFLGQQRKRLEKRGLHRDSSIELRGLLASAGAIPPKVGKKYTNVREIRHIPGVDGSSENSGRKRSYTRRSPSRMRRR